MRKVYLYMTMSMDGFIAGPNNELDWMQQAMDPEMTQDAVELFERADTGLIGYPTGVGMIGYWESAAKNPAASQSEHDIALALNKIHGILISKKEEQVKPANSELLVVKNDDELVEAVARLKRQPGKDIGVPGGVRTAQTFARLGLFDEYVFMVHPVAIGAGKRVFTQKADLKLISAKVYESGVMRVSYRPR